MAHSVIDISGDWRFKEYPVSARRMRDLDDGSWYSCTCPNSIFTNLIQAYQIDEKDLLSEPEKYEWVSERSWIYKKIFDVTEQILDCNKIELVCDGLDTIASVWLNEKLIGKTDNMFISHRFDITKYLREEKNTILIRFEPAVTYAKKMMERYTPFSDQDFANPYRSYIRKAQFQFGWDFCPSLPGCGIFKPVRIEGINDARIENLHIRTINCTQKTADIRIAVDIDSVTNKAMLCKANVFNPEDNLIETIDFEPHNNSASAVLQIDEPKLWWPAGYGPQNLYRVEIDLMADGTLVDRRTSRFGIRTLNLNQAHDRTGNMFRFEINSQAIYAKGANWLPISIFAGSVTEDDYRELLTNAANANVNMLRVWGGGYYEDDIFYQLCDELGIMVWQDFMFACAYYPDRHWFLKKIAAETKSVIRRIYNHPSLVLYCGNNEIHWLFGDQKKGRGRKFHGKTIFDKLLPKLLSELDPERPYINSTPFSKKGKPNETNSGTIHNWSIWSGDKPVRDYITSPDSVPRFVTEFGSQSLPSFETLKSVCPADKMKLAALSIEKHNYQLDGNSRLYRYTADVFGPENDLERFIHLTQLAQARAAKSYVEFLRASNSKNSGVLFWQYNDVCPAITWSAIDYKKNPKALYYYAKRFFSPLLVTILPHYRSSLNSADVRYDRLDLVIVNDTGKPVTGNITCSLMDFYGNKIDSMELPAALAPYSILRPVKLPKALTFPDEPQKVLMKVIFETDRVAAADNLFFYLPDKHIEFPKVDIQRRLNCIEDERAILTLTSNVFSRDVYIELDDNIVPDDNYIDLFPNEPRQVELKLACSLENIQRQININSLLSL